MLIIKYCPILTEIPNSFFMTDCYGCPWLKHDPLYEKNIKNLRHLQCFCRKNVTFWRFKRWIKSRGFAEWFYGPNQWGGRAIKRSIAREIENNSTTGKEME